jgi:NADPH:quinone reductase-like Zn-dependent oxidoreductase
MKRYAYDATSIIGGVPGAALGLRKDEIVSPLPGPGQVHVEVRASSLNFVDLVTLSGALPGADGLVPLLDGAGIVTAIGSGVTRWRAGDRVLANPNQLWLAGEPAPDCSGVVLGCTTDGMLCEVASIPEFGLVAIPESLTFEQAASLPCAGLSAWNSLRGGPTARACDPGETILIQGTGGVSLFALQFAKAMGCKVIATTSSADKEKKLKALGADETINYVECADWASEVLRMTGGIGVDLVVEVGGPNTLPQSVRAARVGGRIALIGIVAGMGSIDYAQLLPINHKVLTVFANGMGSRRDLEAMLRLVDHEGIRPVIDAVFPFNRAEDAFRHFAHRRHIGKVVIAHDRND